MSRPINSYGIENMKWVNAYGAIGDNTMVCEHNLGDPSPPSSASLVNWWQLLRQRRAMMFRGRQRSHISGAVWLLRGEIMCALLLHVFYQRCDVHFSSCAMVVNKNYKSFEFGLNAMPWRIMPLISSSDTKLYLLTYIYEIKNMNKWAFPH